jgi:hypothetical protein
MKKLKKIIIVALCFLSLTGYSQSIWGGEVVDFKQGTTNLNSSIIEERSDSIKSLGMTTNSDDENFVSLGFGGSITIRMSQPIKNGDGFDLKIWETTYESPSCERYPEKAFVFASQDGCNFLPLGLVCQDEELDLKDLNWANYIRIIDVSPTNGFIRYGEVDAYDLDAVEGYYLETVMEPTELKSGYATGVIQYTQGTRKNGTPIALSRTNPLNALGIPQGNDLVNFVSLGFGGSLILSLDFAKFNQPGWDLQLIETTYGNPSCLDYPEKVFVEVSKDLENWEYVDILCLDGYIDVQNIDWFKYVRLTDRSAATKFSESADGYDVDGVLVIQDCETLQSRIVERDDIFTPDEESDDILYPNPFSDVIYLTNPQEVTINVMDFAGRKVKSFTGSEKFDVSDLRSSYYYFEINYPDGTKNISKLIKK